VHEEVVTRDMVPSFVKLLKDTEAEVRTAVAGQIPGNPITDPWPGLPVKIANR
jgi:hypothetical protein